MTYPYHIQVHCIEFKIRSTKSDVFQNTRTAVLLSFSPLLVSFVISLQHAGQKNVDRNSHLATTSHTFALTCASNSYKRRRENNMKNTIPTHITTIQTAKRGFLRTCVQSGLAVNSMQATR